jgi:hypothetical protein
MPVVVEPASKSAEICVEPVPMLGLVGAEEARYVDRTLPFAET